MCSGYRCVAFGGQNENQHWLDLRKRAWIASQMKQIEDDPRIYIRYQDALKVEVFNREFPFDRETYKCRPCEAWDHEHKQVVDWVKSGGPSDLAGSVPGALGNTTRYLKLIEKSVKVYDKWDQEEARRFVNQQRTSIDTVLSDIYDTGPDYGAKAKRGPEPDFLTAIKAIANDYHSVAPTASDSQVFNAALMGDTLASFYKSLAALTDNRTRRFSPRKSLLGLTSRNT
jgi:hypothetical protein